MKISHYFIKYSSVFIALLFFNFLCAQKYILVSNKSSIDREEIITIPFNKFSSYFHVDTVFTVKNKENGTILIHQLEKLGTQKAQNVLIQVTVKAGNAIQLEVLKEKPENYISKTFARYVPERKDDFAWENDKVAFRYYGKALEGTSEDAQGIDFWAKRTPQLIINKWYKTNDYHKDHGEGLDYYSVGQSLGVGDMALFFNDSIQYTKHYRTFQVLDNGPLRSTFKLIFEPEQIKNHDISFSKIISLDAGEQFNKTIISFNNKQSATTPIVIGISKRTTPPNYAYNNRNNSLVYWEPDINNNGNTGTAVIIPNSKTTLVSDHPKQFLVKTKIKNNKSFAYYNGAVWSRAGKVKTFDEWQKAVNQFDVKIKQPLKVKLK